MFPAFPFTRRQGSIGEPGIKRMTFTFPSRLAAVHRWHYISCMSHTGRPICMSVPVGVAPRRPPPSAAAMTRTSRDAWFLVAWFALLQTSSCTSSRLQLQPRRREMGLLPRVKPLGQPRLQPPHAVTLFFSTSTDFRLLLISICRFPPFPDHGCYADSLE